MVILFVLNIGVLRFGFFFTNIQDLLFKNDPMQELIDAFFLIVYALDTKNSFYSDGERCLILDYLHLKITII